MRLGWPIGRLVGWHDTGEIREIYQAYAYIEHGAKKPVKAESVESKKELVYVDGHGYLTKKKADELKGLCDG